MVKIKRKQYQYSGSFSDVEGLLKAIKSDSKDFDADLARTHTFIAEAFNQYETAQQVLQVDFAFLIPLRVSGLEETYWVDVYDFLPALKYADKELKYKIISHIPPCKIELYGQEGEQPKGVMIFTPVFIDMLNDHKSKLLLRRKLNGIINDTVDFAVKKYGVRYVGLGATLPKITNYGNSIKTNVTTTTGHAGTTWLILETFKHVINNKFKGKKITVGFVGGGSIGAASMKLIAKKHKNFAYLLHDKRTSVNKKNLADIEKITPNVEIAKSNSDLIRRSDVVISAVTSAIDVDKIDLTNKVIIDDSQPGSFNKKQVEKSGGKLVWVVGNNELGKAYFQRRKGYDYGPLGFASSEDLWGCEAEVAAIANKDNPKLAIKKAVSTTDVINIDLLFKEYGIVTAQPQAYGEVTKL